jgi:hypothetical protein
MMFASALSPQLSGFVDPEEARLPQKKVVFGRAVLLRNRWRLAQNPCTLGFHVLPESCSIFPFDLNRGVFQI